MQINLMWLAKLSCVLLISYGALDAWRHRAADPGPGVVAATAPQQQLLPEGARPSIWLNNYQLTPLAEFSLEARVLGNEPYRLDPTSDISPLDLALGWGPMSDQAVLDKINLEQSSRWLSWRTESVPFSVVNSHSANVHIIPRNESLKKRLMALRVGEVVSLKGYLVAARRDGQQGAWTSSLSRNDTGDGACEVFYVQDVQLL